MKESAKFWIQTLLAPIVIVIAGYIINSTLENQQREFDKLKFTEQILSEAFDSNNANKAFALAKLIPVLIDDKAFADTLIHLINSHYIAEAAKALQLGNDSVYQQISDAAKTYQLDGLSDSLKKNPVTAKAEDAIAYENAGLQQIQQGNLIEAQKSFEQSKKVYPGFHSSNEISNELKEKNNDVKQGGDSVKAKREIMESVRKNYSWKLPLRKTMK